MRADKIELAGLWLAIFAQTASFTVYSPLVPLMKADLGFSYADFGLLATAFYIPYTALQVVVGTYAGRGRIRSLMLPGMATIFVSTVLLGASTSLPEALLLRFVTGAAGATIFVPCVMVIARRYPGRTNYALGIFGTGVAAGPLYISLIAPTLGGALGWRLAIVLAMLPAVVVWAVLFLRISDFQPRSGAGPAPRGSWTTVLRSRITWLLGYQQLARVGMWATILTFLPTFFAEGLGYPTSVASAALTVFAVLAAVSSVLGARMVVSFKSNAKVTLLSLAVMAASLILIGLVTVGLAPWLLAGALGIVIFMAFGPQFTIATDFFPLESLGLAVGVQAVLGNVGATVMPYVFGGLRDATGGFGSSWEVCGLICVLAAAVGLALWRAERGLKQQVSPVLVTGGAARATE
ncbi:MAG TPA: MFS transporter [Nitrososphaerales archaeon]|nr:MFS transporter [Nitrososphaerales archaeon]